MTCHLAPGIVICTAGPEPPLVRVRYLHCPTCDRKRRFTERFAGIWYAPTFTCLQCGDGWSDGYRLERPFKRGWRDESRAAARRELAVAVSADEYRAGVMRDMERYLS